MRRPLAHPTFWRTGCSRGRLDRPATVSGEHGPQLAQHLGDDLPRCRGRELQAARAPIETPHLIGENGPSARLHQESEPSRRSAPCHALRGRAARAGQRPAFQAGGAIRALDRPAGRHFHSNWRAAHVVTPLVMKMAETAWNADLRSAQRAEGPRATRRSSSWATEVRERPLRPVAPRENHPAGRRRAVRCAVAQRVPTRGRRSKPAAPTGRSADPPDCIFTATGPAGGRRSAACRNKTKGPPPRRAAGLEGACAGRS